MPREPARPATALTLVVFAAVVIVLAMYGPRPNTLDVTPVVAEPESTASEQGAEIFDSPEATSTDFQFMQLGGATVASLRTVFLAAIAI